MGPGANVEVEEYHPEEEPLPEGVNGYCNLCGQPFKRLNAHLARSHKSEWRARRRAEAREKAKRTAKWRAARKKGAAKRAAALKAAEGKTARKRARPGRKAVK